MEGIDGTCFTLSSLETFTSGLACKCKYGLCFHCHVFIQGNMYIHEIFQLLIIIEEVCLSQHFHSQAKNKLYKRNQAVLLFI